VLKSGTVWYEGQEVFGRDKDPEESDEMARYEARMYGLLGQHASIVPYLPWARDAHPGLRRRSTAQGVWGYD
jgi:hypothetical protein